MNLYAAFRQEWLKQGLDRACIRTADRTYTYAEIDQLTARLAYRLSENFQVRVGDRVAAQVEKSPEAFLLYLATLRIGAIFLPLNTAYQAAEIAYFLQDAEPKIFVCDPAREEEMRLSSQNCRFISLDKNGQGELTADLSKERSSIYEASDTDLAAILYTSGTTGRSKGAMLSHLNLRSNGQALAKAWGFTPSDRLLHALPIYHVHGLFLSLHCALFSVSEVLWLPKFDAKEVLAWLPKATVFMGVPTYYTRLLEERDFGEVRNIRLFVSGSAPLRTETFREFADRTGQRILERYGMTETGVNASNPLEGERRPGTVGLPLSGVEIRVRGETGMIEVRGPNLFQGYWRQPDRTREEILPDGFFQTGDLGEWDERGYLKIVGRAKDLVISGGFNVYPKEIELLLDDIQGVGESAVFGVPHPDFGEAVVAAIVPAPGAEITEERLIRIVKRQVASFKVPKRIVFLEQLPRNAMGKVQKNVLRDSYQDLFS